MNENQVRLAHFPFFEVLAQSPDESSAEWRVAKAGLLTLRMLDDWAEWGAEVITSNVWGVHVVRRTITDIEAGNPLRGLLLSILDTIRKTPDGFASDVTPQLMAYARGLEFDARWALAADVYQTVIKHARPLVDTDVVVSAYMSMGACLRMLASWKEATAAYKAAGSLAELRGDMESVIRSQIAMANVSINRGNLPQAEKILDKAITRAEEVGLEEVRAVALHDRAAVAHHRGDFELAIRLGYRALRGTSEHAQRDRVLADMAASFFELGLRDTARDAHVILAATAQQQHTRWLSTINLLEIAATDGNEAVFEQYRRQLAGAPLPASLAVYYYFYVGQGYRAFRKVGFALEALEQAIAIASAHGLNELLFKAEQSLNEVRSGRQPEFTDAPALPAKSEPSGIVVDVAKAISQMRGLVASAV